MLTLESVSVYKKAKTLIKDVTLTIVPGELMVVLGPNGAGKSTLLKCMIGEESASSGFIALEGKSLNAWSVRELSKRRAVVSQNVTLTFPFSTLEVVQMGIHEDAVLHDSKALCLDVLARMGVASLAHQSYQELSGGEQQRVQIARALVQLESVSNDATQYLFLDEPTSALDLHHQTQLMKQLQTLASSNMAIVCVLHDLQLAAQYADRLVLLQEGKVLGLGDVTSQLTQERVETLYQVSNHVIQHPTSGRPMVLLE